MDEKQLEDLIRSFIDKTYSRSDISLPDAFLNGYFGSMLEHIHRIGNDEIKSYIENTLKPIGVNKI